MEIHIYPVTRGRGFVDPYDAYRVGIGTADTAVMSMSRGWAYRLVMRVYRPKWLTRKVQRGEAGMFRQTRKMIRNAVKEYRKPCIGMIFPSPVSEQCLRMLLLSGWRMREADRGDGGRRGQGHLGPLTYWIESN